MVDKSTSVTEIERALVAIRRSQARRSLARLSRRRAGRSDVPDAVVDLLDAVDGAGPLTVTEAAAALGVDQPRASRLAAQALDAGLLRRGADPADGRRSPLTLAAAGRRLLDRVRAFRRDVVAEATAGWSAADRAALGRLLTRFVTDFAALTRDP
ncbi:MarR family winged helix-turn-helix transcriptional regulator [Actinocatenispora rupis]|uniref:MarR family transcriptional regulator n=1 Tax=Actinocatenispora rupis TaxID=519421 RepID=A0A8J3IWE1_9ACTN|nr:MarR family winged helix-turn-helix transcriptional regulator [Actinocatenispora rupis]GID11216.1 MarR family transcriptional regulator [Actinocatenispora rupis]